MSPSPSRQLHLPKIALKAMQSKTSTFGPLIASIQTVWRIDSDSWMRMVRRHSTLISFTRSLT